jgi:glycosyltransferase involved in cell wall biosynthesis
MGNLKILLLTDGVYPFVMGGMQKHSYYLAKYLHQAGATVDLAHCVYELDPMPEIEEEQEKIGIPSDNLFCFRFPKSGKLPGHYIANSFKYSRELYQIFRTELNTYDLIYAQGFTAWYFLMKTKPSKRPPIIVNLHGLEMYQTAYSLKEKATKRLLRLPTDFLLKKADILQSLGGKLTPLLQQKAPKSKIWECGIGIEKSWMLDALPQSTPTHPIRFVFVGRNELRKGLHILHDVSQSMGSEHKFTFDFIGPIEVKFQLNGTAFTYHGAIQEEESIKALLRTCDVIVVPSLSEGMPTVILEAMASGLAVIASDVGAVRNLVDTQNGIVIRPGNVNDLKAALISYIHLAPEILKAHQSASLQKVKAFEWEELAQKHLHFFNSIVPKK